MSYYIPGIIVLVVFIAVILFLISLLVCDKEVKEV